MQSLHRNLPNTEEAKDMVDAICIEVFSHLLEAVFPPLEAIFIHFLPIVGRESPVLTLNREVIRWRTGLAVHIEELRRNPGINACAANADRNVAL